jgi:hypothetical protein
MSNPFTQPFTSRNTLLAGIGRDVLPVTPSDSADIVPGSVAMGIICKGDAGDVAFVTAAGVQRTYPIEAGETLPVGIARILATGTTATGIWAFLL